MSTIKTTLTGYATYRGREGHLSFLLHRITGLGTLLFLIIHIVDMAAYYWWPGFFEEAMALYKTPLFGAGEVALVFCVFYHGANGIRIAVADMFSPRQWALEFQRKAALWTFIITLVLWLPAAAVMIYKMVIHS